MTRRATTPTPRRFVPQDGSRDLAPHAHRVELTAPPGSVVMPALCPNCGARAAQTIPVYKVFRRVYDESPNSYVVAAANIPFCTPCANAHAADVVRLSSRERLLGRFASSETIPVVVVGLAGLFFLSASLRVSITSPLSRGLVPLVIAVVCFVIAGLCALNAWNSNARSEIVPQTRVTLAFDFGDEDSRLFESPRWTYVVRDPDFAEAFIDANRERVWTPGGPEAQRAERFSRMTMIAIGVVVIGMVIWALIAPG